MKTYVLTLSQNFPKGHINAGEPTGFKEKLLAGKKIHTIRANYGLWLKRIGQIQAGEACLSIREWSGKPYRSKQVEIARLTKENGVGIEQVTLPHIANLTDVFNQFPGLDINDGLTREQWLDWFKDYKKGEPMAIIHFSPFRYFHRQFKTPEFEGIKNAIPLTANRMQKPVQPHTEEEFKKSMQRMDKDTLLRTLYLPFVMMDVYFDYVDTALDMAALLRVQELKRVCRLIKEQWREYEHNKSRHLDQLHRNRETDHSVDFVEEHSKELGHEYTRVTGKFQQERPQLDSEWQVFIGSVYMGLIVFKALRVICAESDRTIKSLWSHAGHTIMPDEVAKTNELLKVCLGDCEGIVTETEMKEAADRIVGIMNGCTFEGNLRWD